MNPEYAAIRFARRGGPHATIVADRDGERRQEGCDHGCASTVRSWWGVCKSADDAIGSILLDMCGRHDMHHDHPCLISMITGPIPTIHRMPCRLFGQNTRPHSWATGRAILAAVLSRTPIEAGRADRTETREAIRLALGADTDGATHLYRTGVLTEGHGRRISVEGLNGSPLCSTPGLAFPLGEPGRRALDCGACFEAADRTIDLHDWVIGTTRVTGDHVGLAVLAACAQLRL